jgi:arylsulfatase A-like enzyme
VFVWKVPGVTPAGGVCGRPVDYSSIYPTLCSLTGLPLPAHLEGRDITPLLKNPKAPWEFPAITTHGRMNHTVRSEEWRYIRYADGSQELYHNAVDPLEYTNLANNPAYAAQKAELARWLPKVDAPDLPAARDGGEGGGGGKKKDKAQKTKKDKQ